MGKKKPWDSLVPLQSGHVPPTKNDSSARVCVCLKMGYTEGCTIWDTPIWHPITFILFGIISTFLLVTLQWINPRWMQMIFRKGTTHGFPYRFVNFPEGRHHFCLSIHIINTYKYHHLMVNPCQPPVLRTNSTFIATGEGGARAANLPPCRGRCGHRAGESLETSDSDFLNGGLLSIIWYINNISIYRYIIDISYNRQI